MVILTTLKGRAVSFPKTGKIASVEGIKNDVFFSD
jgi:hypothetical protein